MTELDRNLLRLKNLRRDKDLIANNIAELQEKLNLLELETQVVSGALLNGETLPPFYDQPHNPEEVATVMVGSNHRLLTRREFFTHRYDWSRAYEELQYFDPDRGWMVMLRRGAQATRPLRHSFTYRTPKTPDDARAATGGEKPEN